MLNRQIMAIKPFQTQFIVNDERITVLVAPDARLRRTARWSLRGATLSLRVPLDLDQSQVEAMLGTIQRRVTRQRERARRQIDSNLMVRDDDGDTIHEVHVNTLEGFWTGLRNFLWPFHGVPKRYLPGYVAIHQVRANAKRLSAPLMAWLVSLSQTNSLPDSSQQGKAENSQARSQYRKTHGKA